ncbi:hypothetical protein VPHD479_0125 [Vibrio phage D479]
MAELKLETKVIAYAAAVTEVEFGWGARPDGYLIAPTRDALVRAQERAREQAKTSKYGYDVVEDIFTITPTAKSIEAMKNSKHEDRVFGINNNLKDYGERV